MLNIGQTYTEFSSFQDQMWHRLAALSATYFNHDLKYTSLIDLGCGNGGRTKSCFELFPDVKQVTAIDSNKQMIDEANHTHFHSNIDYRVQNINELENFQQKQFDIVTSNWALHWIKDKDRLFENINKMTRSGSMMLLSSCEKLPDILADMDSSIRRFIKPAEELPLYYLHRKEWEDLAHRHGWQVCDGITDVEHRNVNSDGSYIREWYAASTAKAFYNRPFEDFQGVFFDELKHSIHEKYKNADESEWHFTEESLFLVLKKR